MQVYQVQSGEDEQQFGGLYDACRAMDGVEYLGSMPQPQVAEHLRTATALLYPNTFPETSCIAVMEAMAAGCQVVTTDLGALRETTAGFARLIPVQTATYARQFVDAACEVLHGMADTRRRDVDDLIRRQLEYVYANCTWARRAQEWEAWLQTL
jgi:glycosyltransferase involved in cell wall biosynthesis